MIVTREASTPRGRIRIAERWLTPGTMIEVDANALIDKAVAESDSTVGSGVYAGTYSVVSATADYSASFGQMILCDGTFTVTLPDIPTGNIGKSIIVVNVGTGMITVDGYGSDTMYDELDMECIPEASLNFRAATSTTWVLT